MERKIRTLGTRKGTTPVMEAPHSATQILSPKL